MVAPREINHARMHGSQGTGSLLAFCESVILPSRPSDSNRQKYRVALNHLTKFLGRSPALADLTSSALHGTITSLIELGRSRKTVKEIRLSLTEIARQAFQHELLKELPCVKPSELPTLKPSPVREPLKPWTPGELEQLFGSARTIPGDIGGIAARRWWPALLLVLLDTEVTVGQLLNVPCSAYDVERGELSAGLFRHRLHSLSVEAIKAILPHNYEKLFHWAWDGGKSGDILLRRMKQLLFRANLPHVTGNLFERLRVTARDSGGILDCLNLSLPFTPRAGKPYLPRARDRRRWENKETAGQSTSSNGSKSSRKKRDRLYRIAIDTPRNLVMFFEESYAPQRLSDSSEDTVAQYKRVLIHFSDWLACDATFEHLEEDIVSRFLAWMKKSKSFSNGTINQHRAELLAVWRHAFRKRKVLELPRDIPKLRQSKLIPEAWSIDEIGLILKAASEIEGVVCGIPSPLFWNALILTLYDSGLRIAALMQAKVSDFDVESRWLKIPAEVQKQDADQVFRLPEDTVAAITATKPSEREWLFPWPFDANGKFKALIGQYRKILKAAGLKSTKRDLFHRIRRTSATAVCQVLGFEAAQQHLGHSNPSVTKRYIDPRKLTGVSTPSERIARPVMVHASGKMTDVPTESRK